MLLIRATDNNFQSLHNAFFTIAINKRKFDMILADRLTEAPEYTDMSYSGLVDIAIATMQVEMWHLFEQRDDFTSIMANDVTKRQFLDCLDTDHQDERLFQVEFAAKDIPPTGVLRSFPVIWTENTTQTKQGQLRLFLNIKNISKDETLEKIRARYPNVLYAILRDSHNTCYPQSHFRPPRWNPMMLSDWARGFIDLHAEHCSIGCHRFAFFRWKILTQLHLTNGVEYRCLMVTTQTLYRAIDTGRLLPQQLSGQVSGLIRLMDYELEVISNHRSIFKKEHNGNLKDLQYMLLYLTNTFRLYNRLIRVESTATGTPSSVYWDDTLSKVSIPAALKEGLKLWSNDMLEKTTWRNSRISLEDSCRQLAVYFDWLCDELQSSEYQIIFTMSTQTDFISAMYEAVTTELRELVHYYVADICTHLMNVSWMEFSRHGFDDGAIVFLKHFRELARNMTKLYYELASIERYRDSISELVNVCSWLTHVVPGWIRIEKYLDANREDGCERQLGPILEEMKWLVVGTVVHQLTNQVKLLLAGRRLHHFCHQLYQADSSEQMFVIMYNFELADEEHFQQIPDIDLLKQIETEIRQQSNHVITQSTRL